jgi:hypothetical protein
MEYIHEMWDGPGHLRFYLQPLLALLLALRDGAGDARAGRQPYLLSIIRARADRGTKLKQLLQTLSKPLAIAVVMDLIFQFIIRGTVRPLYSVIYASLFVALPYVVVRALTNRVVRRTPGRRVPT